MVQIAIFVDKILHENVKLTLLTNLNFENEVKSNAC